MPTPPSSVQTGVHRWFRFLVAAILSAALASFAAPAIAQPTGLRVRVGMGGSARLLDGGRAVALRVGGVCSPGAKVLEAFVYVTQDGFTSQMPGIPLTCDGTFHSSVVRVDALDAPFHAGEATSSAYALVEDPKTGQTASHSPFRPITIVG